MKQGSDMPFMTKMPKQQIAGTMEIVFTKIFINFGQVNSDSPSEEVKSLQNFKKYMLNPELVADFKCGNFEGTKSYILIPCTLWKKFQIVFKDTNGKVLYTMNEDDGHHYWKEAETTFLELIVSAQELPTMETLYNPYDCGDGFPRSGDFYNKLQNHLDKTFNRKGSPYNNVSRNTPCFMPYIWKPIPQRTVLPINTKRFTVVDLYGMYEMLPQTSNDISPKIVNFFDTEKIIRPVTMELSPCITNIIHNQNQPKR